MENKDIKFTVFGAIISVIGLAFVIASLFIDNPIKKAYLFLASFIIFLVHRVLEFINIKRTRKISSVMIVVILFGIFYVLKYRLALI